MPPALNLLRDALASAHALRLALRVRRIDASSLARHARELAVLPALPVALEPERARRAARLAGGLLRRLGQLDSCLTRSLVVAALLSDRPGVVLHVSAPRVRDGRLVAPGHAWVTVEGEVVTEATDGTGEPPAEELFRLDVRRS